MKSAHLLYHPEPQAKAQQSHQRSTNEQTPKGKSLQRHHMIYWGSDEEEVIISSNDERTESENETVDTEINSLLDIPVQQKTPSVKHAPLLNVLVSMIPSMATPTPSTTLPTTKIQATTIIATGPSLIVLLRLSELEKKVEALSRVDHFKVIINEVKNHLPKVVSNFVESRMEMHSSDVCSNSSRFILPQAKRRIRNSLRSNSSMPSKNKCQGGRNDSDPRKYNSTWFKQPPRPKTLDPEWNQDKNVDDGPEQTWFNDLVNAEKDSLTFDELMATPIDFTKFAMNRLKLDKITKADLVGPVYKLLKGTCKSSIELEYNMDQCYNALTDQLD
ncbi:hypothetical protein Tco_0213286 [Tanacetum coccineum]